MLSKHAIKQVKTQARSAHITGLNPEITIQNGLCPRPVFQLRAQPSITFPLAALPQRPDAKCYAASPENQPAESNTTTAKNKNNNKYNNGSTNGPNSVELETAKELAAREFTWFDSLRELLGHTGNDPGHWNFSPEWWGTQGGGFGRTEGQIVFSKESKFNGLVEVTTHPASLNGFKSELSSAFGDETRQEWRVLRFNKVTRQSVSRVAIISDGGIDGSSARLNLQQRQWLEAGQSIISYPECVAAEYLKTIASVLGALVGLQGLFQSSGKTKGNGATLSPPAESRRSLKVLCIGLGGGTLPHFIAHHFPQAHVDAVEIDPVVVEAAIEAMGLPVNTLSNLNLITEDAFEFLNSRKTATNNGFVDNYDVVCIDAFDGDDNVPTPLFSSEFVELLGTCLNKNHGTVLMNFHDTFDVSSIGKRFYDSLVLGNTAGNNTSGSGCCFTVDTQKQRNLTLAVARGLELPSDVEAAKERLRYAGVYVGNESGYRFPAGVRAERNFKRLC